MEAVLFQIVRALATVFEITLAFAPLNAMFEPKYASKWPLRLSYILLLAAVFSSSARLTVISVKTAVEILLVFLVSLLVFRGRLSIKVFYNLIFSTVLFLSDLLSAFALSFLPQELFLFPTGDILHRLLEIVLPKICLLYTSYLERVIVMPEDRILITGRYTGEDTAYGEQGGRQRQDANEEIMHDCCSSFRSSPALGLF